VKAMRVQFLLVVAGLVAGCRSYVPLTTPAPQPGSYLAATLTESGRAELSGYLGPGAGIVRGRLLDDTEQGLTLSVQSVALRGGDDVSWRGETVTVPHALIARLEERRVSKARSALLAAAGMAGFVALLDALNVIGNSTGGPPGGPGPTPQ